MGCSEKNFFQKIGFRYNRNVKFSRNWFSLIIKTGFNQKLKTKEKQAEVFRSTDSKKLISLVNQKRTGFDLE